MTWKDGYWVNCEKEFPNVTRNGKSYEEIMEDIYDSEINANYRNEKIPSEAINPFALGHYINHPPPGESSNVMFVDFDIPLTWLPSSFSQYIPYMNHRPFEKLNSYKAIAIISN